MKKTEKKNINYISYYINQIFKCKWKPIKNAEII